jgi:hypothetical protein
LDHMQNQMNPIHSSTPFLWGPFWLYPLIYVLSLPSGLFSSGFPTSLFYKHISCISERAVLEGALCLQNFAAVNLFVLSWYGNDICQ